MKNTRVTAVNTTWYLLALLICIFSTTSCSEDSSKEIPQKWINVQEDPFSISYEGGTLTREFTLPEGVNPDYVYVISGDDWCSATVDEGSKLNITVGASSTIKERKSIVTLVYDDQHKVELTVVQQAAPPTPVSEIKFSEDLNGHTIYIGVPYDLTKYTTVLPENASYKDLRFTIIEGENFATITDGILKGIAAGTVKVQAAATDDSGVTAIMTITIDSKQVYDRTEWTVDTSIKYANGQNYATDASTGKPEHLFDGNQATFLSLIKPGKTLTITNGPVFTTPADHKLSFTVDMKKENEFNFLQWGHRSNNTQTYLRVWGITLYGSHDGTKFDEIQKGMAVDSKPNIIFDIVLNQKSTYRYIKVEYTDWSDLNGNTNGTSLQVGEFGVGMNYQ